MKTITFAASLFSLFLLAPVAAEANGLGNCSLDPNTCVDGTNIIGMKVTVYDFDNGGGGISSGDPTVPSGGAKPWVKTYWPAKGLASSGNLIPYDSYPQ